MKKIIYFLLLFFLIPSVFAETLPNNYNTTESIYNSNTVVLNYDFHTSDSLSYISLDFQLSKNNYPYTIITTFKSSDNNILKIQEKYVLYSGFPFDTVNRNTTTIYNNVLLTGTKDLFEGNNINYTIFNPFETKNSWNRKYKFTTVSVITQSDLSSRTIHYKLNNDFFINQINLSSLPEYSYIRLGYFDNGIAIAESNLNEAFDSYNPIFKLIFMFAKGTLWTFNTLGIISDNTYYDYQLTFIGEGSLLYYLNFIINLIFTILKWIATMGLLWTFSICSMIIFLYSYIQAKNDMMLCFKLFIQYEKSFIMTVFVNPLMYVYEKFLKFWK